MKLIIWRIALAVTLVLLNASIWVHGRAGMLLSSIALTVLICSIAIRPSLSSVVNELRGMLRDRRHQVTALEAQLRANGIKPDHHYGTNVNPYAHGQPGHKFCGPDCPRYERM